jgi:hypothetical protein
VRRGYRSEGWREISNVGISQKRDNFMQIRIVENTQESHIGMIPLLGNCRANGGFSLIAQICTGVSRVFPGATAALATQFE